MFSTPFNKFATLIIASLFTLTTATPASTNVRSFIAVGEVAAVAAGPGTDASLLYSQNSAGAIVQTCSSGAFTVGHANCDTTTIVPPNEVVYGSPIAAVNDEFKTIRVYFVSQDNTLSEYIYTPGIGFQGGADCPACVTHQGFKVVSGSQTLYVMGSTATSPELRVGFISQGAPGTITEAVYDGTNWQTAGLPN